MHDLKRRIASFLKANLVLILAILGAAGFGSVTSGHEKLALAAIFFLCVIMLFLGGRFSNASIRDAKFAEGRSAPLIEMLRSLEKSPGESREYERFVFAHLVPYLRKEPDAHRDIWERMLYPVLYRLIDHVDEMRRTEDAAFRSEPEPQDAAAYKKKLDELTELELLAKAMRRVAGADMRTHELERREFVPTMN